MPRPPHSSSFDHPNNISYYVHISASTNTRTVVIVVTRCTAHTFACSMNCQHVSLFQHVQHFWATHVRLFYARIKISCFAFLMPYCCSGTTGSKEWNYRKEGI
jgi:hypothetical protein